MACHHENFEVCFSCRHIDARYCQVQSSKIDHQSHTLEILLLGAHQEQYNLLLGAVMLPLGRLTTAAQPIRRQPVQKSDNTISSSGCVSTCNVNDFRYLQQLFILILITTNWITLRQSSEQSIQGNASPQWWSLLIKPTLTFTNKSQWQDRNSVKMYLVLHKHFPLWFPIHLSYTLNIWNMGKHRHCSYKMKPSVCGRVTLHLI